MPVEPQSKPTTERAINLFVLDKQTQGMDGDVLKKYERELGRFAEFMSKRGFFFPHEITLKSLTVFRRH